jgi:hypothetical protein
MAAPPSGNKTTKATDRGNRTPKKKAAKKPAKAATPAKIRFTATLVRPRRASTSGAGGASTSGGWCFLMLPKRASSKLPSRGQATVEGTLNGSAFCATLQPDGQGGHWLKVSRKLRESSGASVGDVVTLEIAPVAPEDEPEPAVPADLRTALAAALPSARQIWSDITPLARRDWIHWIVSARQPQTRARRIDSACDMLAKGKRRPCCFDRSGLYSRSMNCPLAE